MKIAILGAGVYGVALGGILTENGYEVVYYDPVMAKNKKENETDQHEIYNDLDKALKKSQMMVLCVPSEPALKLIPKLPKNKPLIVASKGFLSDKPFTKFKRWEVLSGPSFAEDIVSHKDVFFTMTSEDLMDLFETDYTFFDLNEDRKAVLMCGALKNVFAILAGKFGLKPHTLAMEDFLGDASYEMGLILTENKANPYAVYGACGLGDLTYSCSPKSRNYNFGLKLRKNPEVKPEGTLEGITTLKRIRDGEIKLPKEAQYLRKLVEESEKWG